MTTTVLDRGTSDYDYWHPYALSSQREPIVGEHSYVERPRLLVLSKQL